MKEQKEIISVLDELIETLRDGQQGFRQAAESVSDPKLKSLFRDYSDQRSRFVTALQTNATRALAVAPSTGEMTCGPAVAHPGDGMTNAAFAETTAGQFSKIVSTNH